MLLTIKYYFLLLKTWLFERLTAKGRQQRKDRAFYGDALAGFKATQATKDIVKNKVFKDANKELNTEKIITFNKGKSLRKPKTSKHKLHKVVALKNKEILEATDQKFSKEKLDVVDA